MTNEEYVSALIDLLAKLNNNEDIDSELLRDIITEAIIKAADEKH